MVLNRRVVLASRPTGVPTKQDFLIEQIDLGEPGEGEILVRNLYASVDPGMRSRLGETASYAEPLPIGGVIESANIGEVIASQNEKFAVGDVVTAGFGWQEYALSDGRGVMKVDEDRLPSTTAIGVLGIPGLTSYFGLLKTGALKEGETVVISSAAGTVGAVAGQIANLKGATVVGIAGGTTKCEWVKNELGFDHVIDYKACDDIRMAVRDVCKGGVDIYFDNVGNAMVEAMLPLMKVGGRIVVSGQIADYNIDDADRPAVRSTSGFITKRLRMEGLVVFDYFREFRQARQEIADWIVSGDIKYHEDISDGLETLPAAFIGLFHGESLGRRLVRLNGSEDGSGGAQG